jgi:hypothetical protein
VNQQQAATIQLDKGLIESGFEFDCHALLGRHSLSCARITNGFLALRWQAH